MVRSKPLDIRNRNEGVQKPVDNDEYSDYGPKGGRGAAGTSESTTAPAAKKAPTVTKEELAKSGLSLRD